jgi:hypothetical protein
MEVEEGGGRDRDREDRDKEGERVGPILKRVHRDGRGSCIANRGEVIPILVRAIMWASPMCAIQAFFHEPLAWRAGPYICIDRRAVSISRLPVWVVSSSFFFSSSTALFASSSMRLGTIPSDLSDMMPRIER